MTQLQSKIYILPDVLFQDMGGEAVLLNVQSGKYYGLNEVGTRLWGLLTEGNNLEIAYRALLEEYDVEAGRLREDVLRLVDDLAAHGLIIVNQTVAAQ
jgi:hypothetical protein